MDYFWKQQDDIPAGMGYPLFGMAHLLCVAITVLAVAIMVMVFRGFDEKGQKKTLRTVGAKWSWLQSQKFGANAQPFYVALDPKTGKPLTGSRGYDEDVAAYMDFLNQGLRNFK